MAVEAQHAMWASGGQNYSRLEAVNSYKERSDDGALDYPSAIASGTARVNLQCKRSKTFVIIVGYCNSGDIINCLRALSFSSTPPSFDILIVENGGAAAFQALIQGLDHPDSPCAPVALFMPLGLENLGINRNAYELVSRQPTFSSRVFVFQMPENLGYAGAINACVQPLLGAAGWDGIWILNPDTEPLPSALFELTQFAAANAKGMVGSLITTGLSAAATGNCGLKWNKLSARTTAVGPSILRSRDVSTGSASAMDAASGASLYVTRDLIRRIGLMDEQYFLYFEDLEWGCRATAIAELGVARQSIVLHKGGTTIGSAETRSARSNLSVYLEFRNRILFVKRRYSGWLVWTTLMQLVYLGAFLPSGALSNLVAAGRGLVAGLRGETGRPDRLLKGHTVR